ncbi:MAG: RpiR family transcriptional regulator, partial [Mesorhizobium sp.]
MTEAGSQDEPVPGPMTEGRDPVRRIPDIISLVK